MAAPLGQRLLATHHLGERGRNVRRRPARRRRIVDENLELFANADGASAVGGVTDANFGKAVVHRPLLGRQQPCHRWPRALLPALLFRHSRHQHALENPFGSRPVCWIVTHPDTSHATKGESWIECKSHARGGLRLLQRTDRRHCRSQQKMTDASLSSVDRNGRIECVCFFRDRHGLSA